MTELFVGEPLGVSKCQDTVKALLGVFGQCPHDYLLHFRCDPRHLLTEQLWRHHGLFGRYLDKGALKGTLSTEPFIDNHTQGILVAGRTRMAVYLLWGHVSNGPSHLLLMLLTQR